MEWPGGVLVSKTARIELSVQALATKPPSPDSPYGTAVAH